MRISDWSSDVCSSDLVRGARARIAPTDRRGADLRHRLFAGLGSLIRCASRSLSRRGWPPPAFLPSRWCPSWVRKVWRARPSIILGLPHRPQPRLWPAIGRASCRERGGQYLEILVVGG